MKEQIYSFKNNCIVSNTSKQQRVEASVIQPVGLVQASLLLATWLWASHSPLMGPWCAPLQKLGIGPCLNWVTIKLDTVIINLKLSTTLMPTCQAHLLCFLIIIKKLFFFFLFLMSHSINFNIMQFCVTPTLIRTQNSKCIFILMNKIK